LLTFSLYPSSYWRFFFYYGDYPWNDAWTFFCFSMSIFFYVMAQWSYNLAKTGNDPGYMDWHHFLSDEDIRLQPEEREKGGNPQRKEEAHQ
jgi:hypothetical protein